MKRQRAVLCANLGQMTMRLNEYFESGWVVIPATLRFTDIGEVFCVIEQEYEKPNSH